MKMTKNEVKRVIDANFNRLCEGLRAVEDYCRFISENDKAFKKIKDIRHLIFKNYKTCVFYRDSVRDMGNNYTTLKELEKKPSDLITANCFRVKESLRALEEYYKIIDLKKSGLFKNVRYDFYELEKNIACFKKNIAEKGTLYAVTEEGGSLLYKKAESVLAGGADILQYRAKKLSFKKMLYEAARLKKLCEKYKKNFIVNDRADLALAVKADGLHLGQDDMDIKTARKILGSGILIGKSTHNLKQLKEAVKEEIDYAAFGPVYATDSKEKPDPVTGLKNISRARKIAGKIPLFLIGGINLKNINDVLNAGGANIALIRALFTAQNPKAAALNFKKRLRKHA